MADYTLIEYTTDWFDKWNFFVAQSNNGTVFHRLDFLSYHGDRFKKSENHLLWLKGEKIVAVLPMIIEEYKDGKIIGKSPYGGSYGGIVTIDPLTYSNSKKIILLLVDYLKSKNVEKLLLTIPLNILNKKHSDTFTFALLEAGFKLVNSDISSVIDLNVDDLVMNTFTSNLRNMVRKAQKAHVYCKLKADIHDFWQLMEKTFDKHNTKPTHSLKEWGFLCEKFPDKCWVDVAYIGNTAVAGIGHLKPNSFTDSSFYLCSDPAYSNTQALSLLLYESIINAKNEGCKWFDFGTSSVNMIARENIFRFKESFGATGIFRHTIMLEINK